MSGWDYTEGFEDAEFFGLEPPVKPLPDPPKYGCFVTLFKFVVLILFTTIGLSIGYAIDITLINPDPPPWYVYTDNNVATYVLGLFFFIIALNIFRY